MGPFGSQRQRMRRMANQGVHHGLFIPQSVPAFLETNGKSWASLRSRAFFQGDAPSQRFVNHAERVVEVHFYLSSRTAAAAAEHFHAQPSAAGPSGDRSLRDRSASLGET